MSAEFFNKKNICIDEVVFIKLNKSSRYFLIVENVFKKIVEPLYGNQSNALKKIIEDHDRTCEVLLINSQPAGVIVYKNDLQSEHGIHNGLELKTLSLCYPEKDKGKGLGSILFKRVDKIALIKNATCIFCTASSKTTALPLAKKMGYEIVDILDQSPSDGTQKFLLMKIFKKG